jgi:heat shock protein HtpX
MELWKLRLSMVGTLAVIFGLSTLFLAVILSLVGSLTITTLAIFVIGLNVVQWLISPYLIGALYHAKELPANENPELHQMVENLSQKSGVSTPKLMLAQIPLPNAMAYGTPISGSRIAVTSGLLQTLNSGEVEAVIGHELGHLKHKDVQIMMFVSLLPALLYYIGYSLTLSSMYNRQKNEGSSSAIIGIFFLIGWFVLYLFTLSLSRLREYYADRHSATIVDNGSQKLSTGLAKIVHASKNMGKNKAQKQNLNAFKALFIADPDRAAVDSAEMSRVAGSDEQKLVEGILSQKLSTGAKIAEVFSTHPNIIKRLKALKETS